MQWKRTTLSFVAVLCLAAVELQAQRPLGNDIRANQRTFGEQWAPRVATAADGSFVVIWRNGTGDSESSEIVARLFNAEGRPRSAEIRVARVVRDGFRGMSVDMAPDGHFVVVWGGGQEDSDLAFGRRFAADGTPVGSRFRLARRRGQESPDVTVAADGSFVAVWAQAVSKEGEFDLDVYLRRFRADGRPLGPEVAAVAGELEEYSPEIARRPGGGYVIAWEIWGGEGSFGDIGAQLFSATGAPSGEEISVNEGSRFREASQYDPSLAVAADGSFAVVWTDINGDDVEFDPEDGLASAGVRGRFYRADGTPFGPESSINSYTSGLQEYSAIAAVPGGYFVIWASGGTQGVVGQDGDRYGVFGRAFHVDGTRRSRELRINRNPAGAQYLPDLDFGSGGKGAAVWMGPDSEDFGVFARRLAG